MTTSAKSEIRSLLSLITDSVHAIESYYQTNGGEVPSLEDTKPHPLDHVPYPSDIRYAVQTLEGACTQLCATVARPGHTVLNRFMSLQQPASIGVVVRSQIADILLDAPQGLPVSEISKRAGIEPRKLARVLRLLCSQHIFKEVAQDVFANNRLSVQLLVENPLSSFAHHTTSYPIPKVAARLADTLLDPKAGFSFTAEDSAFSRAFDYKDSLYVYFEGKDNNDGALMGSRFGRGMMGWNNVNEVDRVYTDFPWAELPKGTIVNDIAGGIGDIAMKLSKRYPHLSFKLQDLPERVREAETKVWPAQCPEAIAEGRIEFKGYDMVNESPIPNCDIYFIKQTIHCFPDDVSVAVLKHTAKVMSPTSRILIHEYKCQGAHRVPDSESEHKQAPAPLLPNFGAGRLRQYALDLLVMESFNGEERTVGGYTKLAEAAGLRFSKFWDLGEMLIIEYVLAK